MPRFFCFAVAAAFVKLAFAQYGIPPAPKRPVTDLYHGVKIIDDYRWLEDWSNPETRAWSDSENAHAHQYLDALPGRERLREQLKAILSTPSAHFGELRRGGNILFALRFQPPKEQPFLVTLPSVNDPESARVILDPAQLDPSGHTAIDFYVPSPDCKYVAVSLSKGGSESGDLSVYETSSGKPLADVIPRVNGGTAGGSVAWTADSSGFYYTRYPRVGRTSARRRRFLPTDLVPPPGRQRLRRSLLTGQRVSQDWRNHSPVTGTGPPHLSHRCKRRRRRVRSLSAWPKWKMGADCTLGRPGISRPLRNRRLPLLAFPQECAQRAIAEDAACKPRYRACQNDHWRIGRFHPIDNAR
jgi:hypothetical protein